MNKQVQKVWYYVTLYWSFWYIGISLVISFNFLSRGFPLCVHIWLHFYHTWPKMPIYGPIWPSLASIGTTYEPLSKPLGPTMSQRGHRGHQRSKMGPYVVVMSTKRAIGHHDCTLGAISGTLCGPNGARDSGPFGTIDAYSGRVGINGSVRKFALYVKVLTKFKCSHLI